MFVELFVTQGGEESADERAIGRFRDQVRKRGRHNGGTFVGLFLLELKGALSNENKLTFGGKHIL